MSMTASRPSAAFTSRRSRLHTTAGRAVADYDKSNGQRGAQRHHGVDRADQAFFLHVLGDSRYSDEKDLVHADAPAFPKVAAINDIRRVRNHIDGRHQRNRAPDARARRERGKCGHAECRRHVPRENTRVLHHHVGHHHR